MTTFVKRTLSGAVFAAVMIGGVYGGQIPFFLLSFVIVLLCLWEFHKLLLPAGMLRRFWAVGVGALPLIFIAATWPTINDIYAITSAVLPILVLATTLQLAAEMFTPTPHPFQNVAIATLGLVYIGMPFAFLIFAVNFPLGYHPNIVMGLLLLTWANDTFAYIFGSRFGKNKLAPAISPGKTWEGTISGGISTILVAWLLSRFFKDLTLENWLVLGAIVAVFGTLGDLVESKLKRTVGVKDSGNLMPGHGGALDRFDAFLFVLPFATAYLLLFK